VFTKFALFVKNFRLQIFRPGRFSQTSQGFAIKKLNFRALPNPPFTCAIPATAPANSIVKAA
jgi:hypothetical protein